MRGTPTDFAGNLKNNKETLLMKKEKLIWYLLGLALLVSAVPSQAQKASATEKAVAALEQQWLQGQKTNNPDLVTPLLADKIVVTQADGKVMDKAETLAFYKKTKWDSAEYTDVKVTAFGDTAIAREDSKAEAPMRPESHSTIMSAGPILG